MAIHEAESYFIELIVWAAGANYQFDKVRLRRVVHRMAIHEAESYFIELIVCAGGPDLFPQDSGQEPVLLQRRRGREIDVVPDNGPGRIRRVGRIEVQVGCSQ